MAYKTNPNETTFAQDIQQLRDAFTMAQLHDGELPELMSGLREHITPAIMAHLFMEVFSRNDLSVPIQLLLPEKIYALQLAEELGPDWLHLFSVVAAFTRKLETF